MGLPVIARICLPWPPCTSGINCSAFACSAGGRPAILAAHWFAASVVPIPPSTAIPSAPPTWREALMTPEAMPAFVRSTAAMPVADTAGIVSAMPAPIRIWNGQIAL